MTSRPDLAKARSTADHSKFEALKGPFASGPEVTKACLTCHTEASKQVHKSIHWSWAFKNEATGQTLGKKNVINAFCGNLTSNEPRCTSCHAGYGWKDATFDFTSETNVDCLVCHDRTGGYRKTPAGAGHPATTPLTIGKDVYNPPDWAKVAQNVGIPGRENCGACHFYGGGGDGVKHGDLDSSLVAPSKALDVHMDAKGLNFTCETCHQSDAHIFAGSRYASTAKDTQGAIHRGAERHVASCESCHGDQPHKAAAPPAAIKAYYLNGHTDKLACQSCHIPEMARGGVPTKTLWDWSTAGKLKDGKPYAEHDAKGADTYLSIKGTFKWEENVAPHYAWFDGKVRYTLVDEKIDPTKIVEVNKIAGSHDDPKSRIWPFKAMRGRQAYDKANDTLVYMNVFGQNDTAYWTNFNWEKAIDAGMKSAGLQFSGQVGFVDTVMYWPLAHMVAPKEQAVACVSCHSRDGRLANLAGFYMPGRDHVRWLDMLGYLAVFGALAGVAAHGALRFAMRGRRGASGGIH
ncbi:MAG: tetrathionate reductase family octaheme c-type cytochrome [Rhizobiales bacterium]|nr:tetrathionate reductase family octaheme c-type cytochrome [Hyphomicrobiales bacterium]